MGKYVKRALKIVVPTFLGLFLFGDIVSAHVEVTPKTSAIGEEETYTVKVPSEKNIPTTKFTIKIPAGFEFDSFEPIAGWKFTTQKDSGGNVTSITYEATGQGILPEEFQRFVFAAKNPDKATKAPWDAYQYYKDGTIVEWTGNEGSDTPHSITNIVSQTSAEQPSNPSAVPTSSAIKDTGAAPAKAETSSLPLTISIISALLSLLSIGFAVRKNRQ